MSVDGSVTRTARELFSFPNPVNEKAARSVAGGVALLTTLTLVLSVTAGRGWLWLSVLLAYGFIARVLTGPTLSPLGQLATRVLAPRLGRANPVAGPPKRFAQAIGTVCTVSAVVSLAFGHDVITRVLLGLVVVAAALESVFAYCVGCKLFAALIRLGLVPEATCAACANVSLRARQA